MRNTRELAYSAGKLLILTRRPVLERCTRLETTTTVYDRYYVCRLGMKESSEACGPLRYLPRYSRPLLSLLHREDMAGHRGRIYLLRRHDSSRDDIVWPPFNISFHISHLSQQPLILPLTIGSLHKHVRISTSRSNRRRSETPKLPRHCCR